MRPLCLALTAAVALSACSGTAPAPDAPAPAGPRFAPVDARTLTYPDLGPITLPEVREVTLGNGLTILLTEDRSLPQVNVRARIGGMGYLFEPLDHTGLASLTAETMRTGGAGDLGPDALNEALENVGASVEVFSGDDASTVSMRALTEHVDRVLPLFADVLRRPRFDADKVELAKTQAKSGISRRNDSPGGIANRELSLALYSEGSPYASVQEYATIDAISRDDMAAFHGERVRPEATTLAVWGDFDAAEMEARLRDALGDWAGTGAAVPAPPAPAFRDGREVLFVEKDDVNQSSVLIGHAGSLRRDDPDYPAVVVMNEVLGGGFGSRLFQTVRTDLGLAYSVGGFYGADYVAPGIFYATTTTKSESTVAAAEAMLETIASMRERAPTDAELALAKDSFLNSFVFRFDSKAEVLGRLLTYRAYGYSEDYLNTLREGIQAVTPDDVLRVSREYLRPDDAKILILGRSADFDRPVASLGAVRELDITIPTGEETAAGDAAAGQALLGRLVDAVGGAEALAALDLYQTRGRSEVLTPQGALQIETVTTIGGADRVRAEQTLPGGQQISIVMNGPSVRFNTPAGPRTPPPGLVQQIMSSLYFSLPYVLAQRDAIAFERVDGEDGAAVLQYTGPGVDATYRMTLGADGRPTRIESQQVGPAGPALQVYTLGDYRETGGLTLPFRYEQTTGGQPAGSTQLQAVVTAPTVTDDTFDAGGE